MFTSLSLNWALTEAVVAFQHVLRDLLLQLHCQRIACWDGLGSAQLVGSFQASVLQIGRTDALLREGESAEQKGAYLEGG